MLDDKEYGIYDLVGKLCESIYRVNKEKSLDNVEDIEKDERNIKRLRARAYEILLNKSSKDEGLHDALCDPVIELLKFAYILKIGVGRISQSNELEEHLDEFIDDKLEEHSVVYSALQFLNSLKTLDSADDTSLNIFYYDGPNPVLPEMLCDKNTIPPFQVFPIESFSLPQKFESLLKKDTDTAVPYGVITHGHKAKPSLLHKFICWEPHLPNVRCNTSINKIIDSKTNNFVNEANYKLSSYFLPQVKNAETFNVQSPSEGIVSEPESPWQSKDILQSFAENKASYKNDQVEICEIIDDSEEQCTETNIWDHVNKDEQISNHRTWETLGQSNFPKELPFASESIDATPHVINIAQSSFLLNDANTSNLISTIDFINNIKLLLLGVESSSFIYSSSNGFEIKKDTTVHGISPSTLENICYEVTHWGTCFKNLSNLIVYNDDTGKLLVEGLIFEALSRSIKEFLLFYHAAILRVTIIEEDNVGLLGFLNKVRPLGNLVTKVAKLCRCDGYQMTSLGEGIGILTHIYKEVTKVTEKNVALIFYSILKECCEVYFMFLQRWIFEGSCCDLHEEFMIKIKPQYTNTRSHRFWTRGFSINHNLVPGFLAGLAESILQCGKAVALLKICDPKNPLYRLSVSKQPPVRVCLSVAMLREQARFYEFYAALGNQERGEQVSMSSAIRSLKEAERKRAKLVIAAQQDTLNRLKKEREDALRKIAKEKQQLLEQLKDQVEQVALRKEKDRQAELLADKLFLENILKQEEQAINSEKAAKISTLKYYADLEDEIKRRRIEKENCTQDRSNQVSTKEEVGDTQVPLEVEVTIAQEDENSNLRENEQAESLAVNILDEENQNLCSDNETNLTPTKALRPTVLDINNVKAEAERNKLKILQYEFELNAPSETGCEVPQMDNLTEAQRNRLKILESEFGFSPVTELPAATRKIENLTEAQRNKLKVLQSEFDLFSTTNNVTVETTNLDNLSEAQKIKKKILESEYGIDNSEKDENNKDVAKVSKLSDAQRNKIKVLQSEYNILSPNNNEQTNIAAIEKNEEEITDLKINKLKILGHSDWHEQDANEMKDTDKEDNANREKKEIDSNRLRNTQHFDFKETQSDLVSINPSELTDAQKNRNRVMSTFYNTSLDINVQQKVGAIESEDISECRKNRNRNMAHTELDYDVLKITEPKTRNTTPMSTATDQFTVSTHSSSNQEQNSDDNTPFSEITNHGEFMSTLSSGIRETKEAINLHETKRDTSNALCDMSPAFPQFIGMVSIPSTPLDLIEDYQPPQQPQQLTTSDVEMIDSTSLQMFLEKSIVVPLTIQSKLVNDAIVKYLLTEHSLLSHLHSLRSYYFLLNGEFAKTLSQLLFTRLYQVNTATEMFNSSILSKFIEKAIISSLSGTYANSELLSLTINKCPSHLQTSDPEILNCLSLNYKMSWPLNIIFNDIVMQQYSKVFKFLLMVGRVLWVLQEDFHILKVERKSSCPKQHRKIQLYRHSMMQFMNALHTYITCSVLHASWSEFEQELEHARTLDEINETHISYLKKILKRSRQKQTTANVENLERIFLAFCEQRAYLAQITEKFASCGYQPHLMHFLHALNINHRYELVKK